MQIKIKDRIISHSWIEINLDAIRKNVLTLRKFLKSDTGIIAVVKSDAYGHGIVKVGHILEDLVDIFAVSALNEVLELRESGIKSPILFLSNPLGKQDLELIFQEDVSPAINSFYFLDMFESYAQEMNKNLNVHLKIDTGMSRLGITYDKRHTLLNSLNKISALNISGCFTHFAYVENIEYTRMQQERFEEVSNMLKSAGYDFKQHAANSSATLRMPSVWYDYVRPGIMLYGVYPDVGLKNKIKLEQAMSFKTRLIEAKTIKKGDYVGYSCTYKAPSDMKIGVIPVGYNQGLPWSLSNRGFVLIRGKRIPVIGRVSMDQTILDLKEMENIQIGEEVVITGRQDGEEISVEEIADWSDTIPYEILCSFGKNKNRIYLKNV